MPEEVGKVHALFEETLESDAKHDASSEPRLMDLKPIWMG